jgi:hypothetical protein
LDNVKRDTENIKGLCLATVRRTTVQVAKLLLYLEQLLKGHNLLHLTWADRGLIQSVYAEL